MCVRVCVPIIACANILASWYGTKKGCVSLDSRMNIKLRFVGIFRILKIQIIASRNIWYQFKGKIRRKSNSIQYFFSGRESTWQAFSSPMWKCLGHAMFCAAHASWALQICSFMCMPVLVSVFVSHISSKLNHHLLKSMCTLTGEFDLDTVIANSWVTSARWIYTRLNRFCSAFIHSKFVGISYTGTDSRTLSLSQSDVINQQRASKCKQDAVNDHIPLINTHQAHTHTHKQTPWFNYKLFVPLLIESWSILVLNSVRQTAEAVYSNHI